MRRYLGVGEEVSLWNFWQIGIAFKKKTELNECGGTGNNNKNA